MIAPTVLQPLTRHPIARLSALGLVNLALLFGSPAFQTSLAGEPSLNLDLARQLNEAFVAVAENVSPAVVVIDVVQRASSLSFDEDEDSPDPAPRNFRRYFRKRLEEQPLEKSRGEGSGIIIRPDGYILTNSHVVEDAESIRVRLKDGRTFKAEIRGIDPQSDVAVIKINASSLPTARLGDSSRARVGEFAIAIGAPFSLDYSITFGHVSAKGRSNIVPFYSGGGAMDQDFIQTDANINPGNSGGPLVNINGEVIGINTLIRGLHTGIGFAIPSNLAREVADELIASGKFTRAWLGVEIFGLRDDADLKTLFKDAENGVVVRSVLSTGPAAKSELRPADIITTVDGTPVGSAQELRAAIRTRQIGVPLKLDVLRNGKPAQITVTPAEWVQQPHELPGATKTTAAATARTVSFGATVRPLTKDLAAQYGLPTQDGVIISSVDKNTPAARAGLKPGDVITSISSSGKMQPVATVKQFRDAIKDADFKKGLIVNLVNATSARFEIVKEDSD